MWREAWLWLSRPLRSSTVTSGPGLSITMFTWRSCGMWTVARSSARGAQLPHWVIPRTEEMTDPGNCLWWVTAATQCAALVTTIQPTQLTTVRPDRWTIIRPDWRTIIRPDRWTLIRPDWRTIIRLDWRTLPIAVCNTWRRYNGTNTVEESGLCAALYYQSIRQYICLFYLPAQLYKVNIHPLLPSVCSLYWAVPALP